MVRRHADMRRAILEQRERRAEHAPHGVDLDAVVVEMAGQREVVPEELVGAVDEMHAHETLLVRRRKLRLCGDGRQSRRRVGR